MSIKYCDKCGRLWPHKCVPFYEHTFRRGHDGAIHTRTKITGYGWYCDKCDTPRRDKGGNIIIEPITIVDSVPHP